MLCELLAEGSIAEDLDKEDVLAHVLCDNDVDGFWKIVIRLPGLWPPTSLHKIFSSLIISFIGFMFFHLSISRLYASRMW